ncbi:IS110 family transposase [Desulforudis sp. 1088]|uniref:IS110 family transposase n=4 Tax=Candidatus Desulforudis TaxID=471826 RepID=UPI003CE548A7
MIFAGIDWADATHQVVVIDDKARMLADFSVKHSRPGLDELGRKLLKLAGQDLANVACIVETSQGLLIQYLLEHGFAVYPVNPKLVDHRRKPSGAKSDPLDARLLADIGRAELPYLRQLRPDSAIIEELKMLTRDQDDLIQERTRLTNKLIACLKLYYPVALDLFSHANTPIFLDFLQAYPTLEKALEASVPEIAVFLKTHKHPQPNKTAVAIWTKLHEPQLEANAATTRAKARLMLSLVTRLKNLQADIKGYDQDIQDLFQSHSDYKIFASLPGAGVRVAPRLLAEWGDDRSRYPGLPAVQALAGTTPVLFQSGKYAYARPRKSCVKPFRNVMYQLAMQSIRWVSWAREYYDAKRAQGKAHATALRCLASVWMRIIYAMWLNNTPYDEALFLAAKERHALRAA